MAVRMVLPTWAIAVSGASTGALVMKYAGSAPSASWISDRTESNSATTASAEPMAAAALGPVPVTSTSGPRWSRLATTS